MIYIFVDVGKVVRYVTLIEPKYVTEYGMPYIDLKNGLKIPRAEYKSYEVEESTVPVGTLVDKYCYVDSKFVLNSDYVEPVATMDLVQKALNGVMELDKKYQLMSDDVTMMQSALTEVYETLLTTCDELTMTQVGLVEQYENDILTEEQLTSVQMALCELYEEEER